MTSGPRRLAASVIFWVSACTLVVATVGCRHETRLVDTPRVMAGERGRQVFDALPAHLQTTDIPVVYFTDRRDRSLDGDDPGAMPDYGSERSQDISFGVARIGLLPEPTWDELVEDSTSEDRTRDYTLTVESVERTGTMASLEGRLRVRDEQVIYPAEASLAFAQDLADFRATLEPFLTDGPEGNAALVFVHGFNNGFDDAVLRLGQTWHAAGRHGIPIVFTWPAGFEAWIAPVAYNHDRESGEFSVLQLKTLLMALAATEDIDRIHLVAHSRGTDVTTTALREIAAEIEAAQGRTFFSQRTRQALGEDVDFVEPAFADGIRPSDVLKLETLVLVAPDLDIDIFTQRFISERVMRIARRVVVYTSKEDGALGLARLFFASRDRLGDAQLEDFDPISRSLINDLPSIEIVECRVGGVSSHAYLFEHPAALSDMIMVIRDGLKPAGSGEGPEPRSADAPLDVRPLQVLEPGFYLLDETYLERVEYSESQLPPG
ncbi:MAG: alpha/beta hydrolase [Phycisphaerales bacterium]|jgi:esterase/lipase superfamily enzyme